MISSLSLGDKSELAKVAKLSPDKILLKREAYHEVLSKIDTLEKSLKFFENEYQGKNRKTYIAHINEDLKRELENLNGVERLPTIGEYIKDQSSKDEVESMILIILNDARHFFQVDNMISNEGIFSLVDVIIEMYRSLTIEDVALCIHRAKAGYYGDIYNRLDGATFLKWFASYEKERSDSLMDRNYAREVNHKAQKDEGRSTTKSLRDIMFEDKTRLMLQRAKSDKRN